MPFQLIQLITHNISNLLKLAKTFWDLGYFQPFLPFRQSRDVNIHVYIIFIYFTVIRFYQEYVEPDDISSASQTSLRREPNPLHPQASTSEDDKVLLPLGENILAQNLGIPIVVVLTKVSEEEQSFLHLCYTT